MSMLHEPHRLTERAPNVALPVRRNLLKAGRADDHVRFESFQLLHAKHGP